MPSSQGFVGSAFKLERLVLANEKLATELVIANNDLVSENEKLLKELIYSNNKLIFQDIEKGKREDEFKVAAQALLVQELEKSKRAGERLLADQERALQQVENGKREVELALAVEEIAFQQSEKGKRVAELVLVDRALAYEKERGNRACDLSIANKKLEAQNIQMEQRAAELAIASQEKIELLAQLLQSQKMESLGLLAGGIAHDMNNVLGAILSLASAQLLILPRDSSAHPAFATTRDAALRGREMVKRLLNFARQGTSENKPMDLNAVILEQVRLLEYTTLAKVHLEMELCPGLRPVNGDASALSHVLMNLCVNAMEAMEEGGTLTLVTRNAGQAGVEVEVRDEGCGMAKEVLDRAMVPFFTTKDVGKGTGLGLAIAYATVKAHGGQVAIESEPGLGTRVTLSFPAGAALEPELIYPDTTGMVGPARPLTVLLVDDDDLILKSTRMLVEALGHAVTTAACGEAALVKLEAGLRPDLVILDMNMPGLGGNRTLPRLRELCPTVPVLLATGRPDQKALDLIASDPGVALLAKPFTLQELQWHLLRVAQEAEAGSQVGPARSD